MPDKVLVDALTTVAGKIGSYHDAETDDAEMHIIADIEETVTAALEGRSQVAYTAFIASIAKIDAVVAAAKRTLECADDLAKEFANAIEGRST